MTTYYIDSVRGSDSNSGTAPGAALKSLDALGAIKLKAGDNVLLARGSEFSSTLKLVASGEVGNPITIGAYGHGNDPLLKGPTGISGSRTSNIVVKDIAIANTAQGAIYAGNATNWVIDNISVSNTGTASGNGSIVFKTGANITVSNSKFDHVASDAVFLMGIDGAKLLNNSVTNIHGHTADGLQINDSNNIVIRGNNIDVSTSLDSTKGGIMIQNASGVVVDHNKVVGGAFGVAVNGWNVTITDNMLSKQDKYGWSASVLVGGSMNLSDYVISGNKISASNFGVALTGLEGDNVTRSDIAVTGNVFTDMVKAALKIDKLSTGSFTGNEIVNSTVSTIRTAEQKAAFAVSDNLTLTHEQAAALHAPHAAPMPEPAAPTLPLPEPAAPTPHSPAPEVSSPSPTKTVGAQIDKFAMTSGLSLSGNIMSNDFGTNGDLMILRSVGSSRVGAKAIDVQGVYGTLHINDAGDFTYTLDRVGLTLLEKSGKQVESFQYKAVDGKVIDTSKLMIDLTDFVHNADHVII